MFAYGQTGSGKTYTMGSGFEVECNPETAGGLGKCVGGCGWVCSGGVGVGGCVLEVWVLVCPGGVGLGVSWEASPLV